MFRSRWRTWVREHTPDRLYDRGLVIPKVKDCGDHEWYMSRADLDACYHCQVTRESFIARVNGPPFEWTSHDLGQPLADLEDKDALWAILDDRA